MYKAFIALVIAANSVAFVAFGTHPWLFFTDYTLLLAAMNPILIAIGAVLIVLNRRQKSN